MNSTIRKVGALGVIGVFGCLVVYLNAVFFGYLAVNAPLTYIRLTREDSLGVENFTAIWLFLAGLLLIATAFMERRALPLCIYILSGVALLFGAGEEISWGQRIFGFHTPDYLMGLNSQHEFNIHNLTGLSFIFAQMDKQLTLIFCIIISAAFFHKKDMILGIPLPSIPLIFAFMIMLSTQSFRHAGVVPSLYHFLSQPSVSLILLFIIYMLFDKKYNLVSAATAIMISVMVFSYMYSVKRGHDTVIYGINEFREYLFGICCLFYSLELLLIRILQTENSRYVADPIGFGRFVFDLGGRFRVPFWLVASIFVILGSIWLAPLKYINTKMEDQIKKDLLIKQIRQLIKQTDPKRETQP